MVQGTASSVGKSVLVGGLCRLFARRGLRVAPFKAQNMSNNAAVCADGGEIGRAQYAQAMAAGVAPTVDMNPILLKPQGERTSQLVVRGEVRGTRTARDYFLRLQLQPQPQPHQDADLWAIVTGSLTRLRTEYELVIAEGAGSPAEINLRRRELVNMRLARHARADVLLVGDIDRGGVFAALLGVWEWLDPEERALVRGFVINKFRGDPTLLPPAPQLLEQRTAVPVLGVVPWLDQLDVPDEDAASLSQRTTSDPLLEIAILRLPHLANFDEFAGLANEAGVQVRWVTRPAELRAPDLVILPGSKATIPDLAWVVERGLGERIGWLAAHDTPVLGICGGFQMLGEAVRDPLRIESDVQHARGLGLLPLQTELNRTKRLARTTGRVQGDVPGIWSALGEVPVEGYEIHVGQTTGQSIPALLDLAGRAEGAVRADGAVAGSYVHGLLETAAPRRALLRALAARRGFSFVPDPTPPDNPYDRVADAIEANLRLDPGELPALAPLAVRSRATIRP
ncbi:MAG: cobyric acid synthase [Chloroflexi bacterium]|nr:cobyric acid synthase [Chloroflexota bacterium]